MKKRLVALVAASAMGLFARPASAKIAAVYASGQGGFQSTGNTDPGLGFELGARVLLFDGYFDYMSFGDDQTVSRGIFGLRGGIGTPAFRLVLRAGAGAIHEERGALTNALAAPSRTGGVARLGASVEGRINPLFWLGFGVDGETYRFADNSVGAPSHGEDVLASLKLMFELGI
jgi:hypothetical protein